MNRENERKANIKLDQDNLSRFAFAVVKNR